MKYFTVHSFHSSRVGNLKSKFRFTPIPEDHPTTVKVLGFVMMWSKKKKKMADQARDDFNFELQFFQNHKNDYFKQCAKHNERANYPKTTRDILESFKKSILLEAAILLGSDLEWMGPSQPPMLSSPALPSSSQQPLQDGVLGSGTTGDDDAHSPRQDGGEDGGPVSPAYHFLIDPIFILQIIHFCSGCLSRNYEICIQTTFSR